MRSAGPYNAPPAHFSRKSGAELTPLDLCLEVDQAVKILERILSKMIAIETHLAPDLEWILGDASQLEQVLINLASNAKDAMPQGGRLLIEARTTLPWTSASARPTRS